VLRIGILTDGLVERRVGGSLHIGNGGVGVYIYNLVAHLRQVDPVNQYVTIRCGGGGLDLYGGGEPHVALRPSWWNRVGRWLDVPYPRVVREHGLDLIHYPNQFGGAFLPRRAKRVVTLHDITPLLFPQHHPLVRRLGYAALMRRSLAAADHVIVDASHTAADLAARGVDPAKISVIPLGAAERFRPGLRSDGFAARYGLPERYVLSVGVLEPRKNHACLIAALARLHADGEPIALVLAGREGWRWRNPLDDPRLAHLRPFVHLHRDVPDADLPELYARATVFAYPSLYEGFGLPVVEAMASGTPVVAARSSALPEVAGDAALFADPHDVEQWVAQLRAVLRDAALRQRLRAAGLQRAAQLRWRQTAERTRAVYEQVCRAH
jgi:glycosyltransferase involved in cell wall biosynthesis